MTHKPLALISVADRTGLVEFAQALTKLGFELLTTSGSGAALTSAGVASTAIEQFTQSPEILDGRVKTLHPSIHAGLLAKLDKPTHVEQLQTHQLRPISVCAVNLYPFSSAVRSGGDVSLAKMTELIDIGGPTMIRAAAKNHAFVLPVIDPADSPRVIEFLATPTTQQDSKFRLELAAKVFQAIAHYDLDIARFISQCAAQEASTPEVAVGGFEGFAAPRTQSLRYGENPHQSAGFYRTSSETKWQQLGGKELSYNNLLDVDASLRIIAAVSTPGRCAAAIIKHANPCGVAYAESALLALQKAKRCDPRSHFGGIIVLDSEVTAEVATEVRGDFAEVLVAPSFAAEALEILSKSGSLRLIAATPNALPGFEVRSCIDGMLIQQRDMLRDSGAREPLGEVLVGQMPADRTDSELAWAVCSQTKSNAIVIAKDGYILGTGAGQMSRVDSVELALTKAKLHGHDVSGAVAASDAFFPFPDGLEFLINAGIKTVIAPTGAKRDAEILAAARTGGINFIGAAKRHFRH